MGAELGWEFWSWEAGRRGRAERPVSSPLLPSGSLSILTMYDGFRAGDTSVLFPFGAVSLPGVCNKGPAGLSS